MKNTFKLIGVIALAAIIGFGFASCGDKDSGDPVNPGGNPPAGDPPTGNGGLAITELADWNGKYVFAVASDKMGNDSTLMACADITGNESRFTMTCAQVSDGTVALNVYNDDGSPYTGSDAATFFIISSNSPEITDADEDTLAGFVFAAMFTGVYKMVTVTFTNGSASGAALDALDVPPLTP